MNDNEILEAINHFKFAARPSSRNSSEPATIADINNLIKEVSNLISNVAKAMKE